MELRIEETSGWKFSISIVNSWELLGRVDMCMGVYIELQQEGELPNQAVVPWVL